MHEGGCGLSDCSCCVDSHLIYPQEAFCFRELDFNYCFNCHLAFL